MTKDHVFRRLRERYGIEPTDRIFGELTFKCATRDGKLILTRGPAEVWDIKLENLKTIIRCVFDRINLRITTVLERNPNV